VYWRVKMAKQLTKKDRVYLEPLARLIHESGRRAVEEGKVLAKPVLPGVTQFVEWAELPFDAQEGRYLQAHFLADRRRMHSVSMALDYARERR
jgi:hypothetical protein